MISLRTFAAKVFAKHIRPYLVARNDARLDSKLRELLAVRNDLDIQRILDFRATYGQSMFPHEFTNAIHEYEIPVGVDEDNAHPYAVVNGYRVYWPRETSPASARTAARQGLIEQHPESPHRYQHAPHEHLHGDWAVLVGASDCLFAMQLIEHFDKLFLFEANPIWKSAMEQTLAPWGGRFEVVTRYVGNTDDGTSVKLDTFFKGNYHRISFIQADVEGAEIRLLLGANSLICQSASLKASICCYHTPWQEREVKDFFDARGYETRFSPGYLDPMTARPLQYPYLRRGVVYASKPDQYIGGS